MRDGGSKKKHICKSYNSSKVLFCGMGPYIIFLLLLLKLEICGNRFGKEQYKFKGAKSQPNLPPCERAFNKLIFRRKFW